MERVTDLADPNRCQGAGPSGQCHFKAEYGDKYCRRCGGISKKNPEEIRSYLLAKAEYQTRLAQLDTQLDPIRELQQSINLIHLLIERRFATIQTDYDVMAACGPLEKLVQRTESLCKTLIQVQKDLNDLLPTSTLINLGEEVVKILIDELQGVEGYEERIDRILQRLQFVMSNIESNTEENNA